jgi:hypothetical protein
MFLELNKARHPEALTVQDVESRLDRSKAPGSICLGCLLYVDKGTLSRCGC